jgi:hypothetical protein
MIVYFAADLLWATRIQATAKQVEVSCRPVRSVDMLKARLADSDVRAAIVDLDNAVVAVELIDALRGKDGLDPGQRIHILAFGPHVAEEAFCRAREAGADTVLARGAFDRRLPDILRELGVSGSPPA